jgi:hypothetical protein
MALLLDNIGFTFPLPDKQLTLLSTAEGNPFSGSVQTNSVNPILSDLERMYW